MAEGTVKIKIDGDASGLEKEIASAKKSASGLESSFKTSFSKISTYAGSALSSFNSFSLGIGRGIAVGTALVATAVTAYGGKVTQMASDLQEVQNVVDVTFGNSADAINKFALDAATQFGLTELSAKQFSGTMGAMLKSSGLSADATYEMSTALTGLTGDFASFYNLDHQEAFDKIRAGISGETEPLKQLGINMSVANLEAYALSEGIKKSYDSMSEAEKVTLRYNYLMSVSADAQGDFARTSDSFANQLRILQLSFTDLGTAIGSELLPSLTDGVGILNDFAQRLKEAFDSGGFEALSEELGNVLSEGLVLMLDQAPEIIDFVVQLMDSFGQTLLKSAPAITSAARKVLDSLLTGFSEGIPTITALAYEIVPLIAEAIIVGYPLLLELGLGLLTAIVAGIADNLDTLIPVAQQALESLVNAIIENLPLLIDGAIEIILSLVEFLVDNLDMILDAGLEILLALVESIVDNVDRLIEAAIEIINKITQFMIDNVDIIMEAALTLIMAIVQGLLDNLPQLIDAIVQLNIAMSQMMIENAWMFVDAALQIIAAIAKSLISNAPQLVSAMWSGITGMLGVITGAFGRFVSAGWELIKSIASGIWNNITAPLEPINNAINDLEGAFDIDWWSIGYDIIAGIANGISGSTGRIMSAAKNAASAAFEAAKDFLGINSPSKLFRDNIGLGIDEGIAVGIDKYSPMVESASKDVANKSLEASTSGLSSIADKARLAFSGSYDAINSGVTNSVSNHTVTNSTSHVTNKEIGEIVVKSDIYLDGDKVGEAVSDKVDSTLAEKENIERQGKF